MVVLSWKKDSKVTLTKENKVNREDVIKRLEALLRMRTDRGATQAEMETAMELAAKLAFKHRINLEEIIPDKQGETHYGDQIIGRDFRTLSPNCHKYIVDLLFRFFAVKVARTNSDAQVKLIGMPMDIDFAMYVYAYLRVSFRKLWLVYKLEVECSNRKEMSFYHGLWMGIREKLEYSITEELRRANIVSNGKAIMLLKDHSTALMRRAKEIVPGFTQGHSSAGYADSNAFNAGKEAAEQVRISKALGGGSARI